MISIFEKSLLKIKNAIIEDNSIELNKILSSVRQKRTEMKNI